MGRFLKRYLKGFSCPPQVVGTYSRYSVLHDQSGALAVRTSGLGILLLMLSLSAAIAFGITASQPGIAIKASVVVAILVTAFLSTEIALYILILSMLLSPEFIVGDLQGSAALGRGITIRLDDILLILIGLGWLAKTAIHKELGLFLKTTLNKPILLYVVAVSISTTLGILFGRVDPLTGFFFALKYFEYFFVYFMLVNTITGAAQVKRYAFLALVTSLLVTLYAAAQIPGGGRVTAPFEGAVGEPNTLGGYLVFMICIVGGLFFTLESPKIKIPLAGLAFLFIVTILATQSRASYLALIVAYLAFLYVSRKNVPVLAFLSLLLVVSPFVLPSSTLDRIAYTVSQPKVVGQAQVFDVRLDTSTSARIRNWEQALADFRNNPITGYGVTGYKFIDAQYPRVLIDTGLLGLGAFLFLLYRLGEQAYLIYRNAEDPYLKGMALGLGIGFLGLLVHAVGANTFIIVRIMEPFWLFVGLVVGYSRLEKRASS